MFFKLHNDIKQDSTNFVCVSGIFFWQTMRSMDGSCLCETFGEKNNKQQLQIYYFDLQILYEILTIFYW